MQDFIYFANYRTVPFFVAEEVVENYFDPDNSPYDSNWKKLSEDEGIPELLSEFRQE